MAEGESADAGTALGESAEGSADDSNDAPSDGERAAEEITELPPTVSVGSRVEQPVLDVPRSISVVDSQGIAIEHSETAGHLVDSVPGVHLQETNRGAGAPIIRGQVGPSNLTLLNGIRLSLPTFRTGPNQYVNHIDPFFLQQIEVLRGSGGVLYGGDAIGGVIAARLRPPTYRKGWGGRAVASVASADTRVAVSPELRWSNEDWSIIAALSATRFGTLRTGGGDEVPASDYYRGGARLTIAHLVTPRTEISGNYVGAMIRDAGRTDRILISNFRSYDDDRHLAWLALDHDGTGAAERVLASLSFDQHREVVDRNNCERAAVFDDAPTEEEVSLTTDPDGCIDGTIGALRVRDADSSGFSTERSESTVSTVGASLTIESAFGATQLAATWGFDIYQSFVQTEASGRKRLTETATELTERIDAVPSIPDDSTYGTYGLFALLDYDLALGEAWSLRPELGARVTHTRADVPDVPIGIDERGEVVPEDLTYDHTGVVGSAQLALVRPPVATVWLGWSQGFRSPNLQETANLGDTGNFFEVPNPDLGPERSDNFEIGTRADTGPVELEAVGFLLQLSDALGREPATWRGRSEINGAEVRRQTNVGGAAYTGVETAARTDSWNGLSLRGDVTWTWGEVERGDETEPARRVPPVRWSSALRWQLPWVPVFAELRLRGAGQQDRLSSGDRDDIRICESQFDGVLESELGETCEGTPSWTTVGMAFGAAFGERVLLRAALDNLTDAEYRHHGSGLSEPGFNARLWLELTDF